MLHKTYLDYFLLFLLIAGGLSRLFQQALHDSLRSTEDGAVLVPGRDRNAVCHRRERSKVTGLHSTIDMVLVVIEIDEIVVAELDGRRSFHQEAGKRFGRFSVRPFRILGKSHLEVPVGTCVVFEHHHIVFQSR